jgi:hypothetical protein
MVREWRYLKLLKRAGITLDGRTIDETKGGELALQCPACPQPDVNLLPGWDACPPHEQ